MLFDSLMIILITLVIAVMCAIGDLVGLWNSWLLCVAGGFTAGLLASTQAAALSKDEEIFLVVGVTLALGALLRWVGAGHTTQAPTMTERTYANDQPAIDDIFDFEEVTP